MGMARHHDQTDVAACWGNLAGAAATGAEGCNSLLLPNPSVMLGDTETGDVVTHLTLPFWKNEGGSSEGLNLSPTGGRQRGSEVTSSNGRTQGDGLGLKGVVVLHGATWADRRIAQASHGNQDGCCGVVDLRVFGASGQNLGDSSGPSRDVNNMQTGKPRVRNICAAKGLGNQADCRAKFAWMLVGLHHCESSQKIWITWEAAGYTSNTFTGGRLGVGAAVIRFKQVKQRLRCKPCQLTEKSGRKLPSVKGCDLVTTGNLCEDLRRAMPSTRTRWVGPRKVSSLTGLAPVLAVVKFAKNPTFFGVGMTWGGRLSIAAFAPVGSRLWAMITSVTPCNVRCLRSELTRSRERSIWRGQGLSTITPRAACEPCGLQLRCLRSTCFPGHIPYGRAPALRLIR